MGEIIVVTSGKGGVGNNNDSKYRCRTFTRLGKRYW